MRCTTHILSLLAIAVTVRGGNTNAGSNNGGAASGGQGSSSNNGGASTGTGGSTGSAAGGVTASQQITSTNQLGIQSKQAGGANNAGAKGTTGANGLPQLPNPQLGNLVRNFNPTTNAGTNGPFKPVSAAVAAATGAPASGSLDASTNQAIQAACDNWSFDTAQVSNFLNTGNSLSGAQFIQAANIAYNAEVNELTHMAILMSTIGNSPDVSIANQTLLTGVFQSVVNNLQIMADQGANKAQLINTINNVRCTQILPSIDAYLAVGANTIGSSATLRTAIRPDACANIVQNAAASQFPGNLKAVNVRGNTNQVTSTAPQANQNVGAVSPQFNIMQQASGGQGSGTPTGTSQGTNSQSGTKARPSKGVQSGSTAQSSMTAQGGTKGQAGSATQSGSAAQTSANTKGGAGANSGTTQGGGKGLSGVPDSGQSKRRALHFAA